MELELQLVDSDSMELCDALHDILSRLSDSVHGGAKPEFYRSCIEINTGICLNVADVRMDLEERLRCLAQAAAESHVSLGWGGTHPFSCWRDQHMVATRRYGELADQFQETLFRQLTFGMHVHVGVPSGEAAILACNGVRRYLPLLLALSANSPFWSGRATGLHAHRAEVMSALPASGPPPRFHDWNDYSSLIERLISGGCIKTSKDLWWDARPSPAYGTVEVRVCDMPPDLPSVLGLTSIIQCLIFVLSRDLFEITDPAAEEVAIRQNRWRAARYGLDADFFDPQSGHSFPVRDLIDTLVDLLSPVARTLGGAAAWLTCEGWHGNRREPRNNSRSFRKPVTCTKSPGLRSFPACTDRPLSMPLTLEVACKPPTTHSHCQPRRRDARSRFSDSSVPA